MSLHYPFPVIKTIDDVLPHIDDNFRVVEKEGLTFVNYNQMGLDVFPTIYHKEAINVHPNSSAHRAAVRRECRGITFDTDTGRCVSRPFHKFFNAGEREDVSLDKIDISEPHQLLEKLDGSMIRPLCTDEGVRWGTKMGITDVAMMAEEFVAGSPMRQNYESFAVACYVMDETPIFEFCSRRSRVVIDYPEETLVLLAIRNNTSGAYLSRWEVRSRAGMAGIPVIENVDSKAQEIPEDKQFVMGGHTLGTVIDTTRNLEDSEGLVVVFDTGHAVKVKSDWYVRIHRAKDMMRSEMRLLDLYYNDELDDLLATIDTDDRTRIEAYLETFKESMRKVCEELAVVYHTVRKVYETKKDFALSSHYASFPAVYRSMLFSIWDGKVAGAEEAITRLVRNSMSSETKFRTMKSDISLATGWEAYQQL
jgi:RNA ligase